MERGRLARIVRFSAGGTPALQYTPLLKEAARAVARVGRCLAVESQVRMVDERTGFRRVKE
jgi:hypothetical protein